MKKKIAEIMVILLLTSMLMLAFNIKQARSLEPPETEWSETYGGTDADSSRCVIQTSDGGYAIVGGTKSYGVGDYDLWMVKTDWTGLMEWNITYGGSGWDFGNCIIETSDGGYAMTGMTNSFGAGSYDFWLIKLAPTTITTIIDIDPDTLNLRSKGKRITCYIELPEGYDADDIDVSTILLNNSIPAQMHPTGIDDEDSDGIPDLMVKFDRAEVTSYIIANVNMTELYEERFMTITLTITGYLNDGTTFEGSDTIRIKSPLSRGLKKLTYPSFF